MSSTAKFNPGKPAVTETVVKVICPAVAPTITAELTLAEAAFVLAAMGPLSSATPGFDTSLYDDLHKALEQAIPGFTDGRQVPMTMKGVYSPKLEGPVARAAIRALAGQVSVLVSRFAPPTP